MEAQGMKYSELNSSSVWIDPRHEVQTSNICISVKINNYCPILKFKLLFYNIINLSFFYVVDLIEKYHRRFSLSFESLFCY